MILKVFETFNEFVEIKKVLGPHLEILIDAALKISSTSSYSLNLREITLLFLELVAENYGKVIVKRLGADVVDKIVYTGFVIASESEEDYEEEQETPHTLSLYMIYNYSCEISKKVIYPTLLKYIQQFGTSQNDLQRKAAIKVLGYICDSDSCLDNIKNDIDEITNFIVQKLQDPSFKVREASAETVGKFSEYVVPDFLDKHEQVVPCLLQVLREMSVSTVQHNSNQDLTTQKGLFALHEFTSNLQDDVKVYLNDLIITLVTFIQSPNYSKDVRFWALQALGSVVTSA